MFNLFPKVKIVKRLFLPVFLGFLLTACQVASPITTTKNFLKELSKNQYAKALEYLLVYDQEKNSLRSLNEEEQQAWLENFQDKIDHITFYTVQNALPLNDEALQEFNANQGYEVFYFLDSEKDGSQNLRLYVFKINGLWKILAPKF